MQGLKIRMLVVKGSFIAGIPPPADRQRSKRHGPRCPAWGRGRAPGTGSFFYRFNADPSGWMSALILMGNEK